MERIRPTITFSEAEGRYTVLFGGSPIMADSRDVEVALSLFRKAHNCSPYLPLEFWRYESKTSARITIDGEVIE
jgi:hypothetical protein